MVLEYRFHVHLKGEMIMEFAKYYNVSDIVDDMIKNEESFVLFIGSTSCTHCDAFKVTINKVVENYDVDIKYIDISKLNNNELSSLQSKFPFSGTPTTISACTGCSSARKAPALSLASCTDAPSITESGRAK